jgi:membrane-bound lytic murein transglycosylase
MAIQIDLSTSQYGTPFAGAYFRIATAAISRQRSGDGSKFSVMIDVAGYATDTPDDDTREVDFRRYYADLIDVEVGEGTQFLDKCYAWVMAQDDMNVSEAV